MTHFGYYYPSFFLKNGISLIPESFPPHFFTCDISFFSPCMFYSLRTFFLLSMKF